MSLPIRSVNYTVIKRKQFGYTSHIHPDWTIYVVIRGSFWCEFDKKRETLLPGDLYIIPPHVPFERSVLEELTVHFLRFEAEELPFPIPRGKLRLADSARLQGTLKKMKALAITPSPQNEWLSRELLLDLLCQCHTERDQASQNNAFVDETVTRVLDFMHENYASKMRIGDVAARFSLSPSGLIFKFRRATGQLPAHALLQIRLEAAKRLLVDTALSLAEIAERTGFENAYYFSTVFKKETGLPPSQYRKTYMI